MFYSRLTAGSGGKGFRALMLAAALSAATAVYGAGVSAVTDLACDQAPADSLLSGSLDEVVVNGQSARHRVDVLRLGVENLELAKMSRVPQIFGENDIIKSIALMPGVRSEGDGGGGFEVRGGTASQNHICLDGITLYNPAHVMGIFSTFNDKALGRATLFKGPFPAQFGGATAAVLETSLAPGDMERWHAAGTIGILAAKVKAEGPIVRDRLSAAVTARRSYVDAFLGIVPQYRGTVMNFYDITAKVRYIPRRGDILDISFIASHDNMALDRLMGMYWGNLGGSVCWTARAGNRLRFITTGAVTDYSPKMSMTLMNIDQELTQYVRDFSVNERVLWNPAGDHRIEFGLRSQLLRVKSAEMKLRDIDQKDTRSGWLNALWINYENNFGERWGLSAGARLSVFSVISASRFRMFTAVGEDVPDLSAATYADIEPRINVRYNITPHHSIKAGAGTATQNLHAVRSSTTSFPFDRYALTSATVRPEKAAQAGAGYSGMTSDGAFDWSAEIYYKDIRNVYDYADGYSMYSRVNLESIILRGRGRSYGAEMMVRKNNGPLTGWVAYTLSHTLTRIPGINGGRWYDAANDRRHDISVAAIYRFNDRWSASASWIFSSGNPITAPDVKYELDGTTVYYYSRRNGYRVPPTHRLDLSATRTLKGRRFTSQWSFGIYNAFCRYNPYVVYFTDDPASPSGTRAVQRALFGLVPSVSYSLNF